MSFANDENYGNPNDLKPGISIGNGRINITGPNTTAVFALQDKIPVSQCDSGYSEAMTGNWYKTPLSTAYFSADNMRILQNGIRAGVYRLSNNKYVIGPQDCDDLKTIMRGVFLQHSKNLPTDIPGQIAALNHLVLDYAVPQVYNEAVAYLKYKQDVSSMYTPIPAPVQSDYNNKTLEMPRWF